MKRIAKPKSVVLLGRRWFDKKWGNTYFSYRLVVDGKLVHTANAEYGYGDSYLFAAEAWMEQSGYLDGESPTALSLRLEALGIAYYSEVIDVAKKSELHKA